MGNTEGNFKEEVLELYLNNKSHKEITDIIKEKYFPNDEFIRVRERCRHIIRRSPQYKQRQSGDVSEEILTSIENGTTVDKISNRLGMDKRIVMAHIETLTDEGYTIDNKGGFLTLKKIIEDNPQIHKLDWNGDKIIRYALHGDAQFGSKYVQISHMHNFYDILEKEGVKDAYDLGDISDGEEMRQGHKYECYTNGTDEIVDEIVKNYPRRKKHKNAFHNRQP